MNTPVRTLLAYLHRLIEYAAFYGVLFTLAGLFDRHHWFLGLFTHLKLPLAGCFIGYTLIELVARHRHHVAAGVIFALVNALPVLMLCLPAPHQPQPTAPATVAQLRILQANILTSNRDAAALLSLIDREAPDVIVLQETGRRWLSDLAVLTNAYPVFAAMPREDNFGAAIFCKGSLTAGVTRASCPCRHLLQKPIACRCGTGILPVDVARASCPCRHLLQKPLACKCGTGILPVDVARASCPCFMGGTPMPRAEIVYLDAYDCVPATRARLTVNGRPLTIIGVHLFVPYNRATWLAQKQQAQRLASLARDVTGSCVVTGDFNTTPWTARFQDILADSGLRDSARGRCLQPTWPAFLPPFARIPLDHALHSPDVHIVTRRLGPSIGSDHLPVILDIAF